MTQHHEMPLNLKALLNEQLVCFNELLEKTEPYIQDTGNCTAEKVLQLLGDRGLQLSRIEQLEFHRKQTFTNTDLSGRNAVAADDELKELYVNLASIAARLFEMDSHIMHSLNIQRLQSVREMTTFSTMKHRSADLWNDRRIGRRIVDLHQK